MNSVLTNDGNRLEERASGSFDSEAGNKKTLILTAAAHSLFITHYSLLKITYVMKRCLCVVLMAAFAISANAQNKMKRYSVAPIQVDTLILVEDAGLSYSTVYLCKSDTLSLGFLYLFNEDATSMEIFNKVVSLDLWDRALCSHPTRYAPSLDDVNLAEDVLAEQMPDGVLPKMYRRTRTIGNPDNYSKYLRQYAFYLNEQGEKCVYIGMEYEGLHYMLNYHIGKWYDACDDNVYVNLNLDKRKVDRAYPSTRQSIIISDW